MVDIESFDSFVSGNEADDSLVEMCDKGDAPSNFCGCGGMEEFRV